MKRRTWKWNIFKQNTDTQKSPTPFSLRLGRIVRRSRVISLRIVTSTQTRAKYFLFFGIEIIRNLEKVISSRSFQMETQVLVGFYSDLGWNPNTSTTFLHLAKMFTGYRTLHIMNKLQLHTRISYLRCIVCRMRIFIYVIRIKWI